jgi:hypothetical protein
MKLVIRSLIVLLVGCLVAAGGYFALGAVPSSAVGGLAGGRDGFRGQPPTGLAAGQMPANLAAGARPPAGAPQFRGDRDGGRYGDRGGRGGREGHGGGSGALGVIENLAQIAIVTVLVVVLAWALRVLGGRRMEPTPDLS